MKYVGLPKPVQATLANVFFKRVKSYAAGKLYKTPVYQGWRHFCMRAALQKKTAET